MTLTELIISSLIAGGAGGAALGAIWNLFTNVFLENRKTRLKKSEFLFQKQFEAASQFMALRRSLMPSYRFPEMEWSDACEDFAQNFKKAERALGDYVSIHGAALGEDALARLSSVIEKCEAGQFEVRGQDREVSAEGVKSAEHMMDELEAIEKQLRDAVWSHL